MSCHCLTVPPSTRHVEQSSGVRQAVPQRNEVAVPPSLLGRRRIGHYAPRVNCGVRHAVAHETESSRHVQLIRDPSLPEHPDPDLAEYRPVSGWGVAALLVGLVSAAASAHPLLWCLPLAGVVVSLIALRRIARSEIKLLGRKAALIGLAFSLIYGIAGSGAANEPRTLARRPRRAIGRRFVNCSAAANGAGVRVLAAIGPERVL